MTKPHKPIVNLSEGLEGQIKEWSWKNANDHFTKGMVVLIQQLIAAHHLKDLNRETIIEAPIPRIEDE
tara:strand:+ start:36 stop:239 length:204 start_codon:yes stop_codon:yes gene_type:complete